MSLAEAPAGPGKQAPIRVDVWSDYVCPFCYLEEPVLDRLRQEYGSRLEVRWRAFELRPDPVPTLPPDGAYLHNIWNRAVYPMAQDRRMTLRLPPVQPRSRKALEAAEFARDQGHFDEMHHALFRGFFEEGRDIGDAEVLAEIAASVGLDTSGLRTALRENRYTDKVVADERLAQELGLGGVPAILVGRAGEPPEKAELVSGAQPYEQLRAAVDRAAGGRGAQAPRGPVFRPTLPTLDG